MITIRNNPSYYSNCVLDGTNTIIDFVRFFGMETPFSFATDEMREQKLSEHAELRKTNRMIYCNFIEPPYPACLTTEHYEFLVKYADEYDLILTNDERLLKVIDHAEIFPFGSSRLLSDKYQGLITSINDDYEYNTQKTEAINFLYNYRKSHYLPGHEIRKQIAQSSYSTKMPFNVYIGTKDNHCVPICSENMIYKDTNKLRCHESMFSVVVENMKNDFYFSVKIVDSFLCKSVPIYYGARKINHFFDVESILQFENMEELSNILHNLTTNDYFRVQKSLIENYNRAKNYSRNISERVVERIQESVSKQ